MTAHGRESLIDLMDTIAKLPSLDPDTRARASELSDFFFIVRRQWTRADPVIRFRATMR